MKRFLLKCALQTQTYRVTRRWYSDRLILLTYHGLTDRRRHPGIANYHGKHLYSETLRAHLTYLKRYYQVISLERALEHYERRTPLPPRSLVLTFDDGYQSVYRLAFPLLKEFGLPAAFFLATDFVSGRSWLWTDRLEYALDTTPATSLSIDLGSGVEKFDLASPAARIACESRLRSRLKQLPQDSLDDVVSLIEDRLGARLSPTGQVPEIYRPAAWQEIREMQASGLVEIGSHTASHVILTRCTDTRAAAELATSRGTIERETGAACTFFCYPNGKPGCFDTRTKALARQAGYRCALTTVEGMNDQHSDVFELKRLPILDNGDLVRFRLSLSGMMGHIDALNTSARRLMARSRVEA